MSAFKNATKNDVTTLTTIYQSPSNTTSIIYGMLISNTTTEPATIDIEVRDNSTLTTVKLVKNLLIPIGSTFMPFSESNKQVLEALDHIAVVSDVAVDVHCSVLEDISPNFKNVVAANVTTVQEILNVTQKSEIIQLDVCNLSTTEATKVTIEMTDDSEAYNIDIIRDGIIPIGSTLSVGKETTNHLDPNDDIDITSDNGVDVIMSYLQGVS